MNVKTIVDEDIVNYCNCSMFISLPTCTWKCCIENNLPITVCQNCQSAQLPTIFIDDDVLIQRYLNNKLTSSIVLGGLEPLDSFDEVYDFIQKLRSYYHCDDTVVIYTGYNVKEVADKVSLLSCFPNIIIKFGRFIPNQQSHYDPILGVNLASENQYAIKIS